MTHIDIKHIDDPDLGHIAAIVDRDSGAILHTVGEEAREVRG